jgi:methionyl aminopeptidase
LAAQGALVAGVQTSRREVPPSIALPDYAKDGMPKGKKDGMPWDVEAQTPEDIAKMRISGRIAREVLDTAIRCVRPGMTTDEIDSIVHDETLKRNAYPSPLNYCGFPKSCCTSINEIICHGIPDSTIVPDGCIMNIDVTIFHNGVHGDCSETILVGNVSDELRALTITTYKALKAAIAICRPGVKYSEIGGAIEDVIKPKGYASVREFCGHGIGRTFHTTPNVLHYKNKQRSGVMAVGHTFTIEPMICAGSAVPVTWPDKWTAATADGSATAQFEHTLLITEDGVEELTAKLSTSPAYAWE